MYVMVGLQGFVGYGLASVFGSVPAELFSGRNYGKIFGFIGAFSNMGAAIGPWATGIFFDISGNYELAFFVAMILWSISIFAMWMASPRAIILVTGQARTVMD
jgi:nitrate/nitrite transporter NarK